MRSICALSFSLLLFSCHPLVKISFKQPVEKTLSTSTLKDYFKGDEKVILLRIPLRNSLVSSVSNDTGHLYGYIEEGFFKRGFEIRDRALFEKVLTQNLNLDYGKAKNLTKTDIILEILSTPEQYSTNQYTKHGRLKTSQCDFQFLGNRIDVKIIKVNENQVAGIYTFYQAPCTGGCTFRKFGCSLRSPSKKINSDSRIPYSIHHTDIELQILAESIVERLAKEMK